MSFIYFFLKKKFLNPIIIFQNKAGDVLRIFHQEAEAFLKAEQRPLFNNSKYSVFAKKIKGKKQESKSSNILFQIELQDPTMGGILGWKTPYRLKHVGTEEYLAVTPAKEHDESHFYLTSELTPITLFELHPVDKSDHISYGSYFRIQHQLTKRYLRVNFTDKINDVNSHEHEILKHLSKSINFEITFGKFTYENVLLFKPVNPTRVDELNAVNSIFAVLEDFCKKVKKNSLSIFFNFSLILG